jgi:hypothetical protein
LSTTKQHSLSEFQSDVAKDGRIDLHLEGDMSSFLSVLYLNNTETGDQEAYIDTLLAQYNMTECNPNKVPFKTSVNLDEITARLPRTPHPEVVSLYAKLIDCRIWKFQRTLKALRATLAISPSLHQSGHRKHQSNQTRSGSR